MNISLNDFIELVFRFLFINVGIFFNSFRMEDAAVAMYNALESSNNYANQFIHQYMAHAEQLGTPWPSVAGLFPYSLHIFNLRNNMC